MRRKGFTLIELLAVIIVLAIIAVIATPMVLNTIGEARQGAAKASANSYVKAIESKVATSLIDNKKYENKDDYVYDEIEVAVKGSTPTGGIYSLKDGVVTTGTFCIDGYEIKYTGEETEVLGKCTGEDLKLSGSVKLSESSGYYEYPISGTFEITENISGGKLSCTSSDEEVATCSIEGTTVTVTPGKKEGTATLTIKSEGSSKYKEAQASHVVTTDGLPTITANGYVGTYDGKAHGITVTSSGTIIKYGIVKGEYTLDQSPTYTDVGTYTVYYQVTKEGCTIEEDSKTVVITKAEGKLELSATKGTVEYNGTQNVEITDNISNGTIVAQAVDKDIVEVSVVNNEVIIKGNKIGTTTIEVTSEETSNYFASNTTYEVTVVKANNTLTLSSNTGNYTYPTTGTFEITENTSGGKLSCETNDEKVADCSIEGTTVTVTPGTTEGAATITVTSAATGNYNAGQAAHVATTAAGLQSVTATGYSGTYDGASHGITVTSSGATIKYGTSEGSYTLDASPTYTDAGTYTVYYQVTRTGYKTVTGSKQVVISKAANPITVAAKSGLTYTGSAQTLATVSGAQGNVCYSTSSAPTSCASAGSIPTGTNAGSYTVYYYVAGNTNYNPKSGSVSVTIAKKADAINVTEKTATYTGSAVTAIFSTTSGLTPTVTYYSNSSCTTTVSGSPVNAGTYYAKATTAGNTNYNAASLTCTRAVTINKANNTLTLSASTGTYTYPTAGTFTVTTNTSGGALSCTTSNSAIATCSVSGTTVTVTPGTTAGAATLTIKSAATGNYNEGQAAHVATTVSGTLSVTATGYSGNYDGAAHGITVTSSGATIKYGTAEGSYTLDSSPTYKDVGEYTVYYEITRPGYTTVTGSKQVVINQAPGPTQVLAANNETYKAIVYLDPTDLTKTCDASNSVSTTGTKEGCMKWYAYKDDGTNYTMILDHNTTAEVAWNSTGSNSEMKEVSTALTSDTATWTSGLNPRLITADEVAQITGAAEALSWSSDKPSHYAPVIGTTISWFYLDGAAGTDAIWHTQIATSEGTSKYAWLYDYTNACTSKGCNVADSITQGYWTSTPVAGDAYEAWDVIRNGSLSSRTVDYAGYGGVRPVITLSKSILS